MGVYFKALPPISIGTTDVMHDCEMLRIRWAFLDSLFIMGVVLGLHHHTVCFR